MNYENWGDRPVPQIDPESEEYWEAARQGSLAVQRCTDCGERQLYPRELCRHCWSRDLTMEDSGGTGTLYSYTRCHVPGRPSYGDETPYVVALVELDLPAENPSGRAVRITSHVDVPDEALELEMPLEVTFRRISDDPEIDLPVFEPRGETDE